MRVMSTTRLLVLGAVKIFQPVHGYFVRRELLSWRADQWAHLNPGSVYNALRSLANDGFLEEVETSSDGRRPAKTSYRLTADGETEFMTLLHEAWWTLNEYLPDLMFAAVSLMSYLPRDEVIAALEHRAAQIQAANRGLVFKESALKGNPWVPDHTVETLRLGLARLDGELTWALALLERVRDGQYVFAGEGPVHAGDDMPAANGHPPPDGRSGAG
jgi:DNA-binding PadR family transcriptional regulator